MEIMNSPGDLSPLAQELVLHWAIFENRESCFFSGPRDPNPLASAEQK